MGGMGHKWVECVITHLSIYDPFICKLITHYQPNPTHLISNILILPNMTHISLKLLEYNLNLQNYQNTLKYLKWPKYPYTSKITNIPLNIQNYSQHL